MTIADLGDTWEPKLQKAARAQQMKDLFVDQNEGSQIIRNAHQLMLEGRIPFDEGEFEFKIEKPNQKELDSQIALMNLRIKSDLPFGAEYEEPEGYDSSVEQPPGDSENPQYEKLANGFGFYAYGADDREGSGVTYIGEW